MPTSVLDHFGALGALKSSLLREGAKPATIRAAVGDAGAHYRQHRDEIIHVLNTNTVPTELKRQAILQEIVRDFARRLLPLKVFSTVFSNVPLQGTDKVEVSFYDLDTGSSTSWDPNTGYAGGNTVTDSREITVDNRKYQGGIFTSEELARQPFLNVMQLMRLKAEKLASDVITDVLSVVTLANFGVAAKIEGASGFDSEDIADLKLACKLWPDGQRALVLDSEYDANLLKDGQFKNALNAASDSVVKEGRLFPRVMGFDYVELPTIPGNSENLTGFVVHPSSILVATAPIPPTEAVRRSGTSYELVTDPETGVSLELRSFGNQVLDRAEHYIECNYGFAKGNANALKRITSA